MHEPRTTKPSAPEPHGYSPSDAIVGSQPNAESSVSEALSLSLQTELPPRNGSAQAPVPPVPPPARSGSPLSNLLAKWFAPASRPAAPAPPPADALPSPGGDQVDASTQPRVRNINLRGRKLPKRSWVQELPAWTVSAIVHGTIFTALAMATMSSQVQEALVKSIDAAPFDPKISGEQAEELVHILNPPAEAERADAVGPLSTTMLVGTPGGASGLGTGSGPPSATPALAGRGAGTARGVGEGSLPSARSIPALSPVQSLLPSRPGLDLGGGGLIAGDVTATTTDIGEALDQLAREILRHLADHKLTVIWLFDESGSMKDDQQAVKEKFDRVATELKLNVGAGRKEAGALNHVIVGFGETVHVDLAKPAEDIDLIGKAIDRLRVDETGIENTMQAIRYVIERFGALVSKERKMLVVLVTDESGDDGSLVEEARQAAVSRGVPIYVIGRQSLFGYDRAHLLYIDPVTKDHYWPAIKRGPETAGLESLQWDGLHERWDEQPSGFAPYELARLVKETGGIYFLLPSEENMRVRQREKAYSMKTLREYVPDYKSRMEYIKQRNASEFRRSLYEIIEGTRTFSFRRHFPVDLAELESAMLQEAPIVRDRLRSLIGVEERLRALAKLRDREPEKRWQAHYDLMLAQIVAYQIKAYEYLACFDHMRELAKQGKLKPSKQPVKDVLGVDWVLDHSRELKAPKAETEKKIAEAERLLKLVIERHPNTPWADLAQDELNRGFGVHNNEWHYSPQYNERAKLVPKY